MRTARYVWKEAAVTARKKVKAREARVVIPACQCELKGLVRAGRVR